LPTRFLTDKVSGYYFTILKQIIIFNHLIIVSKIRALIFDLGGVILDIDQERTLRAFNKLGLDLEELNYQMPVFNNFEIGKISIEEFRVIIKTALNGLADDARIDHAWNAMLLELPKSRLQILRQLKQHFRLYLLSNTNALHMQYFYNYLEQKYSVEEWQNTFDHIFYSHEIALRKPDLSCYKYVCDTIGFAPEQCIFIDDSIINIRGAENAGLKICHADTPLNSDLANRIISLCRTSKPEYN
jgi:putative hydrolase of the HAD superfamily